MPKFAVQIVRIGYAIREIVVDAENSKLAERKAMDESGNYTFEEHDADYEVENCMEVPSDYET